MKSWLLLLLSVVTVMEWTDTLWILSQDTDEDSGCTASGEKCVASASCQNQECVCPSGHQGDGRIACAPQDEHLCLVKEDYEVTGFGGATSTVTFPCSSRLAKFNVHYRGLYRHVVCVLDVFTVAQPTAFRFRPYAVWVHLSLINSAQWHKVDADLVKTAASGNKGFESVFKAGRRVRITVSGERGECLWYTKDLKLQVHDDGVTVSTEWNGVNVISTYDDVDNFAVLSIPECGTIVQFRSADLQTGNSTINFQQVPAISIQAPSSVNWNSIVYNSEPYAGYSLCGLPAEGPKLWGRIRMKMGLSNNLESAFRFAVTSYSTQRPQRPPNLEPEECLEHPVNILPCERRTRAIRSCAPILYKVKLIKCLRRKLIGQNVTLQYQLFQSCFRFICKGETGFCSHVLIDNGNSSSPDWICDTHLHYSLRQSLGRGCEDHIIGRFPGNRTLNFRRH